MVIFLSGRRRIESELALPVDVALLAVELVTPLLSVVAIIAVVLLVITAVFNPGMVVVIVTPVLL